MGALIFLLIVNTRRIRVQSIEQAFAVQVEQAEAEPIIVELPEEPVLEPLVLFEPPIEEIQGPVFSAHPELNIDYTEIWNEKIAMLELARNNQKNFLDDQNIKLQQAKQNLLNSNSKFQRLQNKHQSITKDRDVLISFEKKMRAEKNQITADILNAQAQIDALKRKQVQQSSKFSIIPYEGNSGTTYRPIYIECTRQGIRFLPEDVVIHANDLEGFTEKFNPLLSGAKALVHFWTAFDRVENSSDSPEPYVLLLVRPNGSVAYYVAKRFLQKLGVRHGYELINDDWELDLPEVNQQAQSACRQSVSELLKKRAQFAKEIRVTQRFVSNGNSFEISKRSSGPFDDDGSPGRPRTLSSSARQNANSIRPTEIHLPGRNSQSIDIEEGEGRTGTRLDQTQANNEARNPVPGNGTGKKNEFYNQPLSKRSELVEDGKFSSPGQHQSSAISKAPTYSQKRLEPGSGRIPTFSLTPKALQQSQRAGTGTVERSAGSDSNRQFANSKLFPDDLRPHGLSGAANDQLYKVDAEKNERRQGQSYSKAKPLVQDFPGRRGGTPSTQMQTTGTIGKSFSASSGKSSSSRKAIKRRWGNSSPNATIGFEKEMTISVTSNRIVIGGEYVLPLNGRTPPADMVEQVIQAIELTARSWERAPEGFYWVPSVKFEVDPGGNQYFERLEKPIRELGIVSIVNYSSKSGTTATKAE